MTLRLTMAEAIGEVFAILVRRGPLRPRKDLKVIFRTQGPRWI